jgi:hypothetical protein
MEFDFTFDVTDDECEVTASFRSTVLGTYPIPKDISAEAYLNEIVAKTAEFYNAYAKQAGLKPVSGNIRHVASSNQLMNWKNWKRVN